MIGTRKPTVKEAVDYLLTVISREQRRAQLADWREKYGEKYAAEVEAMVRAKWGKK